MKVPPLELTDLLSAIASGPAVILAIVKLEGTTIFAWTPDTVKLLAKNEIGQLIVSPDFAGTIPPTKRGPWLRLVSAWNRKSAVFKSACVRMVA